MLPYHRRPRGKNRFSGLFIACCLLAAGTLTACDLDLLGLTYRKIGGDYALMKGEDGKTFYVVDRTRKDEKGGDVLGGEIAWIAWTQDTIMAQLSPRAAGAPDVWMIIDIARKKISGPYSLAGIHRMHAGKRLPIWKPNMAWSEL